MSNASRVKDVTQLQDVESVIEAIKELVKLLDCVAIVGAEFPEVSAVLTEGDETFREALPLGDGVHLVLSLGAMPTKLVAGIHEIEV